MELACNIITRKDYKISSNIDAVNKFKNLRISEKIKNLSVKEYITLVKSKSFKSVASKFADLLVSNDDNDLGKAILMAYYISNYCNEIFKPIKTSNDMKLINAANILLYHLNEIEHNNISTSFLNDNFIDAIDHYYSLYKKWTSNEKLNDISNLMDKLIDIMNGHKNKSDTKKIKKYIKRMFDVNVNFAIKSLLDNYEIFHGIDEVLDIVWDNIRSKVKDYIHVFVIMLAEIRVKLIKLINSAVDRKNIYYNVDIDMIIKNIRNNKFNVNEFNTIFGIILESIHKFDNGIEYPVKFHDFNKESINHILIMFKQIFQILYNKQQIN